MQHLKTNGIIGRHLKILLECCPSSDVPTSPSSVLRWTVALCDLSEDEVIELTGSADVRVLTDC